MEALGCQQRQVVIFRLIHLTHPLRELKRGPYLLGQLLGVLYIWNLLQLPPPTMHINHLSPPFHPLLIFIHRGFHRKMVSLIFPTLDSQLLKEAFHIGLQLWWGSQVKLQGRWFSLLTLPPWGAICWGMGRAVLREGPVFSPLPPLTSFFIGPNFCKGCRCLASP